MSNPACHLLTFRGLRLAAFLCFAGSALNLNAATPVIGDAIKKAFDVPAAEAPLALKQFAQQSGLELLYSATEIGGAKTNAIKGVYTSQDALTKMLSGTKLIATPGKNRGAVAVTRAPSPNG